MYEFVFTWSVRPLYNKIISFLLKVGKASYFLLKEYENWT